MVAPSSQRDNVFIDDFNSFHGINVDIMRMTQDTDMLLDSLRNQANSAHRSKFLDDSYPKIEVYEDSTTRIIMQEMNSTAKESKEQIKQQKIFEEEDDEMIDELTRLETFSASLRDSLVVDVDSNMDSSPLMLQPICFEEGVLENPPEFPELPKDTSNTQSVEVSDKAYTNEMQVSEKLEKGLLSAEMEGGVMCFSEKAGVVRSVQSRLSRILKVAFLVVCTVAIVLLVV